MTSATGAPRIPARCETGRARTSALLLLALFTAVSRPGLAAGQEPFDFVDLDEGVFAAVVRPDPPMAVFANALVAIGHDGALVVDTHQSPSAARAVIAEIRRRTDRPVRWVVHTHWHGDHVYGDAAYREAFPDAVFVGHRTYGEDLATRGAERLDEERRSLPEAIDERVVWLASGVGPEGEALSDADRTRAERGLRLRRRQLAELEDLELVPPDRTFEESMTIPLGGRTARLLHLGPAHTRGDVVVHLPESRILAVGDLLEEGEPWIDEDTDVAGWARALEAIAAIDAGILLPSHGGIQRDGSLLATYRAAFDTLAPGAAGTGTATSPEDSLMAADRAFARETAERGVEGWIAWFAEDGTMVTGGGEIRGHEAIRGAMAPLLSNPTTGFEWEPKRGAVYGDLGYTVGEYRVTRLDPDSGTVVETTSHGMYLTIWRRDADGGWKVVEDIGAPAAGE